MLPGAEGMVSQERTHVFRHQDNQLFYHLLKVCAGYYSQMHPTTRLSTRILSILSLSFALADAKPWKGAEVITKETFKYGAFEARILASGGGGVITPFFLWKDGSEVSGAKWQEQDFEIFGRNGYYQTQAMTPGIPQRTEHVKEHVLPTLASERYYTYRMEWTPDSLAYYVNGVQVRKETNKTEFAKMLDPALAEPAQLRVGIWAGDFPWSGAFDSTKVPTASFVNWIRVFDYTPGAGPAGSNFTPRWRDDFDAWEWTRWWTANWTFEFAVNDYMTENAAVRSGALVVALTHWTGVGAFPPVPLDTFAEVGNATLPPPPVYPLADMLDMIYSGRTILRVDASEYSNCLDFTFRNYGAQACGTDDVDLELTKTTPPTCAISRTLAGEWVEYDVDLPESGRMGIVLEAASYAGEHLMDVSIDGAAGQQVVVPYSGSWNTYIDTRVPPVFMEAGRHKIRIRWARDGVNLDGFRIEKVESTERYVIPSLHALPTVVQAEDFARFSDADVANTGRSYRSTAVDVHQKAPGTAGYYVLHTNGGEWLEYDIDAPWGGMWSAALRMASAYTAKSLSVFLDGVRIEASVPSPSAGAEAWSDVAIKPFHLDSGRHVLRLRVNTWGVNIDQIDIQSISKDPPKTVPFKVPALQAVATPGKVSLAWGAAVRAENYEVFRLSEAEIGPRLLATLQTLSFDDVAVEANTAYRYFVLPTNILGAGASSDTITVLTMPTQDNQAPVVVRGVGAEDRDVVFETSHATLSWQVTDNTGIGSVSIAGVAATEIAGGHYQATVPLVVGVNEIQIRATDLFGNEALDAVRITRAVDAVAPTLLPDALTLDQTVPFETNTIRATWLVTDNDVLGEVRIGGQIVSPSGSGYSAVVPLLVGANTVSIEASDRQGNRGFGEIHVIRLPDVTAPVLTASAGTQDRTVANSVASLELSWTVVDPGQVASVTINGVVVTGIADTYSVQAPLAVGLNSFEIVATDVAGNVSRQSVLIRRDTPPADVVKAQYQAGSVGATNGIRPLLKLVNAGVSAIPLSEITVRYWFTKDGAPGLSYWCDWAQVGSANIVGRFEPVTPARVGADTYLELSFKEAAGNLAPSASTGEIQSRFSKSNWASFDQTGDASYDATKSAYADWAGVTVYRNGVLIWGQEPSTP